MAMLSNTIIYGILDIDNSGAQAKESTIFSQYINEDNTYNCVIRDGIIVGSLNSRCIGYNGLDIVFGDNSNKGTTSLLGKNVIVKATNYAVLGTEKLYSDTNSIVLNSESNINVNSINNKDIIFDCNAVDIDGKIIIDSNTYGTTLPASGTLGQVFFKLV